MSVNRCPALPWAYVNAYSLFGQGGSVGRRIYAKDERDSTKIVVADNEAAMAVMMAQLEVAT